MVRWTCSKCGYSTEKSAQPRSCNYCSKVGTMKPEQNAAEVLNLED
jgi:rubrerythrin